MSLSITRWMPFCIGTGVWQKGFIQYQFVVPMHAKQGLIEILQRISDKGIGSFLAVLKVFGKQESMISFPEEGYTLALDIPVRKGLLNSWMSWIRSY
ncbi:hypothetical protein [Paraflavitalea speifideaquila]|uniref:hypothetical protein n=1 Tax=Paraflavitalea speifideaquila TaxID=3076558 RepID=UPI0028EB83D5|nr:hypothetical protein [Paraflavitalea speifideiaquila]